jgi:hypothetical protein
LLCVNIVRFELDLNNQYKTTLLLNLGIG